MYTFRSILRWRSVIPQPIPCQPLIIILLACSLAKGFTKGIALDFLSYPLLESSTNTLNIDFSRKIGDEDVDKHLKETLKSVQLLTTNAT